MSSDASDASNPGSQAAALLPLCASADLREGGKAVLFEVLADGQSCRAFVVRFEGQPHAYLNRCAHLPLEMDMLPGHFFDDTGLWLTCSTHGALYRPASGECVDGPCRSARLLKLDVHEQDGQVFWRPSAHVQPAFGD